jgi:ankyrin repeat protein
MFHFLENMILDHHQFAHRLFNSILQNEDIYDIKILLLKSYRINIDLNCLEYNGQSLVHLCCLYNRLDLLKLFVEFGNCDILAMNHDGWLPLHIAVYLGHMNIVLYLLKSN